MTRTDKRIHRTLLLRIKHQKSLHIRSLTVSSVTLQKRHLPEGLRGCRGGSRLRQPRHRIRHPAGEPPLPRRRGGEGQGPLRKQGEEHLDSTTDRTTEAPGGPKSSMGQTQ